MWFQLNTTFSTHLGALSTLQSNYGVTYSLSNFTKDFTDPTHCPDMVAKNGSITVTLTMAPNTTFSVASITDGTNQTSYLQTDVVNNKLTMTLAEVKGPVTVIARAVSTVVEPTMYTFTINPNPADATVVLTAPGYTQVGNSITVPAGTSVNYTVSKTGYVAERDVKLVSGDETITINLVEAEEPETPTSYTFTINPDPTSATVTLSATGYSTVSGTGSQSIAVANGTKVNWSVSANGYTTRTGDWTISGGNKTEDIVLVASGGEDEGSGDTLSLGTLYENSKYNYVATTTPVTYTIVEDTTKAYFVYEPAPVTPNTQYRCANARASFFLDGNKTVIGERVNIKNTYTDYTFTTPEGCEYLSLSFSYADISPNDVILEKK